MMINQQFDVVLIGLSHNMGIAAGASSLESGT